MPACETSKPRRLPAALLGALAAALCACVASAAGALAPPAQAAAGAGAFVERASSPAPVSGLAADPETGLIYAQEDEGTRFFSYDPRTDAWTELAKAPISDEFYGGSGAVYLGGKIYTTYPVYGATSMGVYDVASNSWTEMTSPLGEGTADITVDGGEIYMAAGETLVKYDPATNASTPLSNPPNMEPAGCSGGFTHWGSLQAYGGKLYGDQGDGCQGFAVYDIAKNSWTELPKVPSGSGEPFSSAVLGGAIEPVSGTYLAYGGFGEDHLFSYDIATEEWTTLALPFKSIGNGGMAYLALPGLSGVYATQGGSQTGFTLYTFEPTADLSVSTGVAPGMTDEVIYTLKIANSGPSEAAKALATDALSANVSLISAQSTQGSCSGTSTITCSLGGLPAKATATVTIRVSAKATVFAANTATVASETLDPRPANDTDTISSLIVLTPAPTPITVSTPSPTTAPVAHCVVPRTHGLTLAALKQALSAAHCALGHVGYRRDRKLGKGLVIASNPYQGAILLAGSRVDVWLSRGSRSVRCVVPGSLRGMSLQRAKKRLRAASCRPGKIERRHNAKVGKGRVITVKPGRGKTWPAGTRIAIWVSEGPRHRR